MGTAAQVVVRGARFLETKALSDPWAHPVLLHSVVHLLEHLARPDVDPLYAPVTAHARCVMDRPSNPGQPPDQAHCSAHAYRGQRLVQCPCSADFYDDIRAAPISESAHRLIPVRVRLIVDRLIGAELTRNRKFLIAA